MPDLENFTDRPFSFYPPILNVEQNEWVFEETSWSEARIYNRKADLRIWIPRRLIGEISQIDDPVMIVGLNQQLEYKGGMLVPSRSRVVEMPRAGQAGPFSPTPPAKPVPRPSRGGSGPERQVGRLIAGALVVAVFVAFAAVMLTRDRQSGGRVSYESVLQTDLGLGAQDDYHAVVRRLGEPAVARWRGETGERQYQALSYPDRGITVILMGAERDRVLYIGAKDARWRNVDSVRLPGGTNTDSILRSLKRF